MFDLRPRGPDKLTRFRRPEFQEKLKKARRFQRKVEPQAKGVGNQLLQRIGLHGHFARWAVFFFLLLIVYFLTISPVFLVKEAVLVSPGIPPEEINRVLGVMAQKRKYLIPTNHILFINERNLTVSLQDNFPEIRRITSMRRITHNKIEIEIEERKAFYVWQTSDSYYLLDQDGIVFQKLLNYDPLIYPEILIVDRTAKDVGTGDRLGIPKILNFVSTLKELWPEIIHETNFVSLTVPGSATLDILVRTGTGFQVYFDLGRSVKTQLRNLNLLLTSEIKPETYSGLSYIDLRLPDTAYYCYRDAPCAFENSTSTPPL